MNERFVLPLALRAHARATPGSIAILAADRAWTFGELDAHADAVGVGLGAAGVHAGDRVALLAAPSAEAIALLAAAARVGACVVPLGTRLTAPELVAAGLEIAPRVAVHDPEHADRAAALGAPTVDLRRLARGAAGAVEAPSSGVEAPSRAVAASPTAAARTPLDLDPAAPAVAVLTSGTTGRPKAALLSHGAMAASAAAWSAALPPATGWLLCLGLAHVAGLGVAWRAIGAGVPLRVLPAFDAGAVIDALRGGEASHVSLVPTQLTRLLDAAEGLVGAERAARERTTGEGRGPAGAAPADVRAVLLGGAPIPPGLVARALASGWPIVTTYGLTEAGSGVTSLATVDAPARPDSAGRPLPGVAVRISDPGSDGVGEILVRTPALFSGYLGRPEATAAAVGPDGWLRTGDAGRLDPEGFLRVVDRRDDLLVSGGESVYPAEVEAVIEMHPTVAEAGVVGRPDSIWGAVPIAAVVVRPGAAVPTEAGLRAFCLARLAPYKVPVAFRFLPALPRTPSGKLRRTRLRELLEADPATGGIEATA